VKLAKEQHEVKSQNWVPILLKTAIEFCFLCLFNNLDFTPIRNRYQRWTKEVVLIMNHHRTSLEETDRMLVEVEKIIRRIPEVAYSRRTGTQMGFYYGTHRGDYHSAKKRSFQD
jgi:hypothetical protein